MCGGHSHACGNPTRIPRKWACGPGAGMGRPRQAEPLPFLLMETQLSAQKPAGLSRTLCSPLLCWLERSFRATAKRGAGADSYRPPSRPHLVSGLIGTCPGPGVLKEQHPRVWFVCWGAGGGTLCLTSLRTIKKGTLTLIQKVTCLVCGWGGRLQERRRELCAFCGFNTVWWWW